MKKLSYNDPEFVRRIMQKQLDIHGAKYEDIIALPEGKMPNGKHWYQHYVFETREQYEEWKEFCIRELRNTRERLSRRDANKMFAWIDLQYGLKHQFIFTWQTSQSAQEQDAD